MTRRLPTATAALLLPGVVLFVGVVATALLVPGAASEVAVHWNAAGEPDGFASPASVVAQVGVGGGAVAVLFAGILLAGRRQADAATATRKLLVAVSVGTTTLISTLGVWMLAVQREASAPVVAWPGILLAVGVGLALGLLTWFLLPPTVPACPVDPRPAEAVPLAATERAVWIGTARMSTTVIVVLGFLSLVLLGGVAWAVFTSDGAAWPVLVVPIGLGILTLGLSSYSVRVDDRGLLVRAVLGIPVWRIAAERVEAAGVVDVEPLGEFGGWGVRIGRGGRTGVITRGGEALQVRRRDGRALVVTVDDAGTAAGLLTALAARATAGGA